MPERPKGADCKSAGSRLRRFESFSLHHLLFRQHLRAGIAQRLEHRPSKPRVAGSNPVSRSIFRPPCGPDGPSGLALHTARRPSSWGARPAVPLGRPAPSDRGPGILGTAPGRPPNMPGLVHPTPFAVAVCPPAAESARSATARRGSDGPGMGARARSEVASEVRSRASEPLPRPRAMPRPGAPRTCPVLASDDIPAHSGLTAGPSVTRFHRSHATPDDFRDRRSSSGCRVLPHASGLITSLPHRLSSQDITTRLRSSRVVRWDAGGSMCPRSSVGRASPW